MPLRVLIIGLAIFLVFVIVRAQFRQHRKKVKQQQGEQAVASMVKCEVCQLHVPKEKAVERGGRFYCGEKHAQGGAKG